MCFIFFRSHNYEGPLQSLPLNTEIFGGRYYYFSGYVKVINTQSTQNVKATMRYTKPGMSNISDQWKSMPSASYK